MDSFPSPPDGGANPSWLRRVFFADSTAPRLRGLRWGWRLAIFGALTGYILAPMLKPQSHVVIFVATPALLGIPEAILLAWVVAAAVIMAVLEKRPFGSYGLPARGAFGSRFWLGMAWGFIALSALLLLIHVCGDYDFGSPTLHGGALARYAGGWALVFLATGFFEEFFFRGYALRNLWEGIGFWPSATVLSALFGAVHLGNSGEDWVGAAAAAFIGLFFCYTVKRTGDLWFAVGLHACWDWAESFFFGVPDSGVIVQGHLLAPPPVHGSVWITGGSVGPEGSLWVFVVIAVMWLLFDWLMPAQTSAAAPVAAAHSPIG